MTEYIISNVTHHLITTSLPSVSSSLYAQHIRSHSQHVGVEKSGYFILVYQVV